MTCIVKAHQVSKKYRISQENPFNTTLVEALTHTTKKLLGKKPKKAEEDFWALQEVDLEIHEGDRLGIIGRNGAGKSTLLKIISRITHPSSGWIQINGRVASLLEVGTGFHPELTGRENIFLNGAILGMKHTEIVAAFDDIVDFAEIAKFLDVPVKRYSSGMYTRLGFAIAAHLNPDLLIVDEVLAVGDSQFQEKCMKKMSDLSSHGRTVIFVSHDLGAVLNLCNKAVFLEKGRVAEFGDTNRCVNAYRRSCRHQTVCWTGDEGDQHIRFYKASIAVQNQHREFFYRNDKAQLEIEYEIFNSAADLIVGFSVLNQRGVVIGQAYSNENDMQMQQLSKQGKHLLSFELDCGMFHPSEYQVQVDCFIHNQKKILGNEIILKFPVYSKEQATRFQGTVQGISFGNKWSTKSL